ncbi:YqeB family protein [Flexivirga meconopsidis]|uniref:YqeB family protein n=1 Tax=Flexivirga meconopsidis TaxID=2977121 RepID=UPI00223F360C|nr:hypothetical protein [Flexivirga meconopsidis]
MSDDAIHLGKPDGPDEKPASLGYTREDRRWMMGLFGAGAAILLGAAPWIARWLQDVPGVPYQDAIDAISRFDDWWAHVVLAAAGLVVGVIGAVVIAATAHYLEVYDDRLVIRHGEDRRTVPRDEIVGVYREGKKVVIDGKGGRRIFEQEVEAKAAQVRDAFTGKGYPYES